jgi:hypothetical protein
LPGGDAGGADCGLLDGGAPGDRACTACLFGDGGVAPITFVPLRPRPDVPGCIATFQGNASIGSCAAAYEQAQSCALAVCSLQCLGASNAAEYACWQGAIQGSCTALLPTSTCFGAHGGDAGALASECALGASPEVQLRTIARVFCGPVTDAGPGDAGAD